MRRAEYITLYCQRSGISKDYYDREFTALPCTCEGREAHWQTVNKEDAKEHLDSLYLPELPQETK